jgi:hypothetical protein
MLAFNPPRHMLTLPSKERTILMDPKSINERTYGVEFMMHEYERVHTLVLDEIRQSEQRVNFFLTIATTVGGALLLFSQLSTLTLEIKFAAIERILAVLLLFGLITFNRLNSRIVQLRAFRKLQD